MSRRNDDDAAPAAAAMAAISTMSTDAAAGIGVDRSARARWARNGRLTLYQEAKEKQGYSDPRKTKLKNDRRVPGLSADILLEKRFQDAKDDLMMTRMLAAFARSQEETHAQGRHPLDAQCTVGGLLLMGYEYLRASGALDQNPSTGVKATEEDHALINDVFKAIRDEPEFTSVCQEAIDEANKLFDDLERANTPGAAGSTAQTATADFSVVDTVLHAHGYSAKASAQTGVRSGRRGIGGFRGFRGRDAQRGMSMALDALRELNNILGLPWLVPIIELVTLAVDCWALRTLHPDWGKKKIAYELLIKDRARLAAIVVGVIKAVVSIPLASHLEFPTSRIFSLGNLSAVGQFIFTPIRVMWEQQWGAGGDLEWLKDHPNAADVLGVIANANKVEPQPGYSRLMQLLSAVRKMVGKPSPTTGLAGARKTLRLLGVNYGAVDMDKLEKWTKVIYDNQPYYRFLFNTRTFFGWLGTGIALIRMTALGRRVFKGWMGEDPQQQLEEKEEAEEEAREKAEQAEEKAREKAERAEEMAARDAAREASRKAARAEERAEAAARQLAKQMQEANRTKFSRLLAAFNAYEAERKKTKQKSRILEAGPIDQLKKDIWALRTKADAFVSSEADSLRNWEKLIEMMKEVKEMIEIVNLGVWNDGHNEIALNMLKERVENFRKETLGITTEDGPSGSGAPVLPGNAGGGDEEEDDDEEDQGFEQFVQQQGQLMPQPGEGPSSGAGPSTAPPPPAAAAAESQPEFAGLNDKRRGRCQ